MTYIGILASAVLHVGGLFLLLTARAPEPLIPLGTDTPVAVDLISLEEYNAITSRAPSSSTLAGLRAQPEAPQNPVVADANPVPDTLDEDTPPPDQPDPSIELAMRLPPAIEDTPPEAEEPPQPESADVAVAPAPEPLALDQEALRDRGVDPADLGPPDDVQVAIAPPAPKPPRGAFDALPEIDTSSDEPPKPAETDGVGEEAQPAPEPPAPEEKPVETARIDDLAPLATPLPLRKPRGSLAVASDEEAPPAAPQVAEAPPPSPEPAPAPPPAAQPEAQLTEAEIEEERRMMEALMEQMRATMPPTEEELRAEAEEQQRLAALDEAERRRREEELRLQAEAQLTARLARQEAAQRAQREADDARRRADEEAQRLAQQELDRQIREEARRQQEARDLAARRQQLAELNATIAPETRANNVLTGAADAAPAPEQDSFLGGDQALASILGAAANAASTANTSRSFGQSAGGGVQGARLTADERLAVLNQLRRCWRVATFSANARDQIVTLRAQIRQNGFVNQATITVVSPNPVPAEYQVAVQRARTALQDLSCQPFALPQAKFNAWRDIEIRFDPAQMVLQ